MPDVPGTLHAKQRNTDSVFKTAGEYEYGLRGDVDADRHSCCEVNVRGN